MSTPTHRVLPLVFSACAILLGSVMIRMAVEVQIDPIPELPPRTRATPVPMLDLPEEPPQRSPVLEPTPLPKNWDIALRMNPIRCDNAFYLVVRDCLVLPERSQNAMEPLFS